MIREELVRGIQPGLSRCREILFAYLHGSALRPGIFRDIDIALFIEPAVYDRLAGQGRLLLGFAIPLEMDLEALIGHKVDVHVLNDAPLSFRYRVVSSGVLVLDGDPDARAEFESLTRVEYFDFRPRRQEYLREVVA
ncbi:MAG: nucleotidyltransferase domain-containing protein [Verrucomicrobiota bacterium]|nr:nucleotidyltransferase domain-containing protein [Verrucomicrobiota bacterium]